MKETTLQPLTKMRTGQAGAIADVTGSRERMQRLFSMGLFVGCHIQMMVNNSGRYVIAVNEKRVARGTPAAQQILVSVEESEDAFTQAVTRLKQIWTR